MSYHFNCVQACGVCVFPKLILALVFLASGLTGYFILEFRIRRQKAATYNQSGSTGLNFSIYVLASGITSYFTLEFRIIRRQKAAS